MKEEILEKIATYVKEGGNLLVTFRSGTRNWNNSMTLRTLPGYFKELSGIEVEEFDSINFGREVKVTTNVGAGTAKIWADILTPLTAQAMATYSSDYYSGAPAITVNSFGKGKVYYVGCDLDQKALNDLIRLIIAETSVTAALPEYIEGIEAVTKEKDGKKYTIIVNHKSTAVEVKINRASYDLLTGSMVNASLFLQPFGVVILE